MKIGAEKRDNVKSVNKNKKQRQNKIKYSIFTRRFDLNLSFFKSYSNRMILFKYQIEWSHRSILFE